MENTHKRNRWKTFFLILGLLNIAVIIVVAALLLSPVDDVKQPEKTVRDLGDSSEFVVRTTKENLNDLVNAYLDNVLDDTDLHYEISFEDDLHLIGELPLFSATVPLSVHLEPFVQDDGNVKLKVNSISLGQLDLPAKKIMKYIDDYLVMPKWVTVNPKEEEIYVALTEMEIKSNFNVRAEVIDLESNNIAFKFFIPYETLGIENGEDDIK